MIKKEPLTIGGHVIPPGETRKLHLKISESYLGNAVKLPLHVIRAEAPGPRVFLTAAVHGDELNGMGIVRELIQNQLPPLVKGTIVAVPIANVFGLERHSRYLPDRRDLNRSFPGSPGESLCSRLAYAIFSEVVIQCDMGIDFHTAAVRRTNYPNVRAYMRSTRARAIAAAFGCEVIVNSRGPKGALRRTATESGVPTIILEAGEVWKIEKNVVEVGVRGCLNVFRELGMIEGEQERPKFQIHVTKTVWVRADLGGILGFAVNPGDVVLRGQELASCQSMLGKERSVIRTPVDGIILGMTTMPVVKPGEPVCHIAVTGRAKLESIRDCLDGRAPEAWLAPDSSPQPEPTSTH